MTLNKFRSAFTFIELMTVIAILAVTSTILLMTIKPLEQMYKSFDARRKIDLTKLKTELESYYDEKNCYPTLNEICYIVGSNVCSICGYESLSPQLSNSYRLPCDPQHAGKDYYYQADTTNPSCPSWYKIYSMLSSPNNPFIYNYGVSSPNTDVEPYPTP